MAKRRPVKKVKQPRGRSTDLDRFPAKAERLLELVASGCSTRLACELVKIGESNLYEWLAKGSVPGGKPVYAEFTERFEKARQDFVLHHLTMIRVHSVKSYQASAWALERCLGEHFGQPAIQMRIAAMEENIREIQRVFKSHDLESPVQIQEGDYHALAAHAKAEEVERAKSKLPYRDEVDKARKREAESKDFVDLLGETGEGRNQ